MNNRIFYPITLLVLSIALVLLAACSQQAVAPAEPAAQKEAPAAVEKAPPATEVEEVQQTPAEEVTDREETAPSDSSLVETPSPLQEALAGKYQGTTVSVGGSGIPRRPLTRPATRCRPPGKNCWRCQTGSLRMAAPPGVSRTASFSQKLNAEIEIDRARGESWQPGTPGKLQDSIQG